MRDAHRRAARPAAPGRRRPSLAAAAVLVPPAPVDALRAAAAAAPRRRRPRVVAVATHALGAHRLARRVRELIVLVLVDERGLLLLVLVETFLRRPNNARGGLRSAASRENTHVAPAASLQLAPRQHQIARRPKPKEREGGAGGVSGRGNASSTRRACSTMSRLDAAADSLTET